MKIDNCPITGSVCQEHNYNKIFKEHAQGVFNYLVFNYGNKLLAEDAVQEAFLILWKNCNNVSIPKAKSYLYTIAKNKLIDTFRNLQLVKKHKMLISNTSTIDKATPEYILEEHEFHGQLNQALSKMPEKYRVPFLLNRIEKKKYKEVAELLDTTVKAVEKRIFNALQFLQNELDINKKQF